METELIFEDAVSKALRDLDIPASLIYSSMSLHREATELVSVGADIYGRDQKLTPYTASCWKAMHMRAQQQGVTLLLVSAFRSVNYQRQIWERKIAAGRSVQEILRVNAPPGYSEHHTGRAVDVTTSECPPVSEEFESTSAFAWLSAHAWTFGFCMTYPRHNQYGIIYEPWHWSISGTAINTEQVM